MKLKQFFGHILKGYNSILLRRSFVYSYQYPHINGITKQHTEEISQKYVSFSLGL